MRKFGLHSIYGRISLLFRKKRMRHMAAAFRLTESTNVLDVGGSLFNWNLIDIRPDLTIINIHLPQGNIEKELWVVGDGRSLPFVDNSFNLCYSNSVIEHVGTFEDQRQFGEEIWRVGKGYYVQTSDA